MWNEGKIQISILHVDLGSLQLLLGDLQARCFSENVQVTTTLFLKKDFHSSFSRSCMKCSFNIIIISKCLSLGSLLCQHDKLCSFQIFCYKLNFVKIKEMRRSRTPAPDLSHSAVSVSCQIPPEVLYLKSDLPSKLCRVARLLTTCQGEQRLSKKLCSVFILNLVIAG